MTDMLLDVDPLMLLDEVIALPCDNPHDVEIAAWSLKCPGCVKVILACQPCREYIDEYIAPHGGTCLDSGHRFPVPLPWLPL
jgi:predicted RNA-binding Zn-ribbon protein involved in translation (DUF1610 family)